MTRRCRNCRIERESHYEKYGYGSNNQCWSCGSYGLEELETITLSGASFACGRRAETLNSESRYCQNSGCYNRTYQGDYCSTHRSSTTNWGYSYSSSAPTCQTEGCSRQTPSSSQSYCQPCQQTQNLIRWVENRTNIRQIKDAEEFSTWWNNNLATVINGDGSFTIWLLVYDDKESKIRDFQTSSNHYGLSNAKSQAFTLRNNLNGDNPILYVHPKANTYANFREIINHYSDNACVKKIYVPYEVIEVEQTWVRKTLRLTINGGPVEEDVYETIKKIDLRNPEFYLKPLDIVWVEKREGGVRYSHVCVYLGNNQVCQIAGDILNKKGARVESWSNFMDGAETTLLAYRLIIPFKHYKKIAKQIDWAGGSYYREGQYNLAKRNCEHFANMLVYGIDFSEQVEDRPGWSASLSNCSSSEVNNGKTTINLRNEITQTDNQLGQTTNSVAQQVEMRVQNSFPIKVNGWL